MHDLTQWLTLLGTVLAFIFILLVGDDVRGIIQAFAALLDGKATKLQAEAHAKLSQMDTDLAAVLPANTIQSQMVNSLLATLTSIAIDDTHPLHKKYKAILDTKVGNRDVADFIEEAYPYAKALVDGTAGNFPALPVAAAPPASPVVINNTVTTTE